MREEVKIGRCCVCERGRARNILMLDRIAPTPGKGWGCVVCGLPSNGAIAVLCDGCVARFQADEGTLRFVCAGYPDEDGRLPFASLLDGAFKHDDAKHALDAV